VDVDRKLRGVATAPLEEFLSYVRRGEIPPLPPAGSSVGGWDRPKGIEGWQARIEGWQARDECVHNGMWAIVDRVWTKALAEWTGRHKALEIMAGVGWLAKALAENGVDIVATDVDSTNKGQHKRAPVFPVQQMEAMEAIKAHPEAEVLLVSWPPCGDAAVVKACEVWGDSRPIVYIGEADGGCNAPEAFWQHFVGEQRRDIPLLSWPGIHDGVYVGFWKYWW
jgi:hypothetical protein